MNKIKYFFSHGLFVTFIVSVAVVIITCTAYDWIGQIKSAENGIEVLVVDSSVTIGDSKQIESFIKEKTNVKYVGVATLDSSDATSYVNTIKNYTLTDYIYTLLIGKDAEILIVPENMLKDIFTLKNIVSIDYSTDNENCLIDGKCYAVPLKDKAITSYGGTLLSSQYDVYGVLLNGDHEKDAKDFLLSLSQSEEK